MVDNKPFGMWHQKGTKTKTKQEFEHQDTTR